MYFFPYFRHIFAVFIYSLFIISSLTSCTDSADEINSKPTVNVPDMVGQNQDFAITAIASANLTKGTITLVANSNVPANIVISQLPPAGTLVDTGTLVELVVSIGPGNINVPDIVGLTQAIAESQLIASGFTNITIKTESSDTIEAGLVISQNPTAGSSVDSQTPVTLSISLGTASIAVPNVTGLLQATAIMNITDAGLTVGAITTNPSNVIAAGNVISQVPTAGALVAASQAINLIVSTGAIATVTVPNVIGSTEAAAKNMLISVGLVVGTVSKIYDDIVPAGNIISLSPSSGTLVAVGSIVNITVSLGPTPVGSGNPFSFIVFGDFNGGGCARNTRVASIVNSMAQEPDIAFYISTGDIIDGYGQSDGSTTCFASTPSVNSSSATVCSPEGNMSQILSPIKDRTPVAGLSASFYPVIGNHDDNWGSQWYPDPCGDGICDFLAPQTPDNYINHTHGDLCAKTQDASTHSRDFYYSFTYQNNYFIILRINNDYNTLLSSCNGQADCVAYCSNPTLLDDATRNQNCWGDNGQYKWLLNELQTASTYDNIFVFSHAVSLAGGDGHVAFSGANKIREVVEAAGADFYFNGHNHAYHRSHAIRGTQLDNTGTTYITTGVAGALTNNPTPDWFTAATVNDWVTPSMSNKPARKASYIKVTVNGIQVTGEVFSPVTQSTPVDTFSNNATTTPASSAPVIAGCQLFPDNNLWNTLVDTLPVHPNSAAYINSIGTNAGLHPDFGSIFNNSNLGIPFDIVDSNTPMVPITFTDPNNGGAGDESDLGDTTACDTSTGPYVGCYPIPTNPSIEGGSINSNLGTDNHILLLNKDSCKLYEVYSTTGQAGNWGGFSGAIWDLGKNEVRPYNVTSADAAGLAILPGLVRYDEVFGPDEINHALRITMQDLQAGFIWPATHSDGSGKNDPNKPPMGLRLRLKASYNIPSTLQPFNQKIMRALKKYGVIIADTGGQMFLSGDHDLRWNDSLLKELENNITANDFEVVDTNPPTTQEVYPYPCNSTNCPTSWPLNY